MLPAARVTTGAEIYRATVHGVGGVDTGAAAVSVPIEVPALSQPLRLPVLLFATPLVRATGLVPSSANKSTKVAAKFLLPVNESNRPAPTPRPFSGGGGEDTGSISPFGSRFLRLRPSGPPFHGSRVR